jgi:S-DNA-T family DNA segregation ATPase FtsK/SpoIIIE
MANKPSHVITAKNVAQAIGVGLIFIVAVFFVSPFSRLSYFAYGLIYLFGTPGYWAFLPFVGLLGFVLAIKGTDIKKIFSWRIYVGFFLFFLGLLALMSYLAFQGTETTADPTMFLNATGYYWSAGAPQHMSLLPFDLNMGGGYAGYYFSGLLLMGGKALDLAIFICLLVLGAGVAFFSPLKRFILWLSRKIQVHNAKRASQKKLAQEKKEADAALKREQANAPLNKAPAPGFYAADISVTAAPEAAPAAKVPAEPPLPSRSEIYGRKDPADGDGLPHEIPTPETVSSPVPAALARSGLHEAVFDPSAASARVFIDKDVTAPTLEAASSAPQIQSSIHSNEVPVFPNGKADGKAVASSLSNQITMPSAAKPLEAPEALKAAPAPSDVTAPSSETAPSFKPSPSFTVVPAPVVKKEAVADDAAPKAAVAKPDKAAPASAPKAPSPIDQCNQPKAAPRPPYKFPPLDLLKTYASTGSEAQNKVDCQKRSEIINQAFADLGVGARVVGFTIGPSVTRYDLQTDKDVSVASIGKYIQDISVRLGGVATRYEEVVRGKSTSGLEIANTTTTTVSLREMVDSLPKGPDKNLYIPFGKSISGDYVCADLSDFPHMLVSGSTGSGKSIFMHGVIMSLIMRNRPEDLKLVVVDPKRVEMTKYADLPHLLCPIIKEPVEAKVCFQKLIDEMERRYMLFELSGVSNIRQFNADYAPSAGFAGLPFIVVVVDEYADLVDSCKDLGDSVVRLAQKARAAGIHLVIATQRPSVSVITGVIKANLPVRVALSVASAVDSMTILGTGGAEELVGHGDMLVDCSLVARNGFTRCQGCYVDNREIKSVVDFIKSEAKVDYDPRFLDLVDHDAQQRAQEALTPQINKEDLRAEASEDFFDTVKAAVMTQEYTSISRIQREFGVGFPRAGKLFAQLQQEGIVALAPETASSSKGCRVLKKSGDAPSANPGSTDNSTLAPTPRPQPAPVSSPANVPSSPMTSPVLAPSPSSAVPGGNAPLGGNKS